MQAGAEGGVQQPKSKLGGGDELRKTRPAAPFTRFAARVIMRARLEPAKALLARQRHKAFMHQQQQNQDAGSDLADVHYRCAGCR